MTDATCPIERALGLLGQRWTVLLLREAGLGATRFSQFQRVGIPPATLTERLAQLVDGGLLAEQPYRVDGQRARTEYVLTAAGRATLPVLVALGEWGSEYVPGEDSIRFVDADSGRRVHQQFVDDRGEVVPAERVSVVRR